MKRCLTLTLLLLVVFVTTNCRQKTATDQLNPTDTKSVRKATENEQKIIDLVAWVDETLKMAPSSMLPCLHYKMQDFPKWHDADPTREQLLPRKWALEVRWSTMELYGRFLTDKLRDGTFRQKSVPGGIGFEVHCGGKQEPGVIDFTSTVTMPKTDAEAAGALQKIRQEFKDAPNFAMPEDLMPEAELAKYLKK